MVSSCTSSPLLRWSNSRPSRFCVSLTCGANDVGAFAATRCMSALSVSTSCRALAGMCDRSPGGYRSLCCCGCGAAAPWAGGWVGPGEPVARGGAPPADGGGGGLVAAGGGPPAAGGGPDLGGAPRGGCDACGGGAAGCEEVGAGAYGFDAGGGAIG
ncbi:hypothetical protein VTK26DRAFT_1816 [Humicola hyalothermophila]